MQGIRATWMRGGTSKCWVFENEDLVESGERVDDLLPRLFGSPDPRQIDGVGGGTSTTSKSIIIQRSRRPGIDVDFTFAQVSVTEPSVNWGSNCGNCSTAAGLYAVESGWVEPDDDVTEVITYNTNADQVIIQRIPTPDGALPTKMSATIPGVRFAGFEVGLGFLDPAGRTTGRLLPTGQAQQSLDVAGRPWRVSMVDAGAPMVILAAEDLGFTADTYSRWSQLIEPLLPDLDTVRRSAAVAMGMVSHPQAAESAVPKLGVVGPTDDDEADINVLMLSMGAPHPAMPITGSVGMTAASSTDGTIVAELLDNESRSSLEAITNLALRTPAGILTTYTDTTGADVVIGISRTARTLASAVLPLPRRTEAAATVDAAIDEKEAS